jgi:hypothetical protein
MAELGRAHAGLPDDLLNFQYDPVACAVAVGWPGAVIEEQRLRPVAEGEVLRFQPNQGGRLVRVVVDLDGASFSDAWLAASRRPSKAHHGARASNYQGNVAWHGTGKPYPSHARNDEGAPGHRRLSDFVLGLAFSFGVEPFNLNKPPPGSRASGSDNGCAGTERGTVVRLRTGGLCGGVLQPALNGQKE